MKLKVAICEDSLEQSSKIEEFCNYIKSIYIVHEVFISGEDLINYLMFSKEMFDIYFLDIEMKEINGIDTAQYIREKDSNAIIMFITSYEKYMIQAFDVLAFRYLIKPLTKQVFEENIMKAYKHLTKIKKKFYFSYDRMDYVIECDKIMYFQKEKRKLYIHTIEGIFNCYMTFEETLKQLDENFFVEISASNIINMSYVKQRFTDNVEMENNKIFNISRGMRLVFKNSYLNYMKNIKR